MTETGPKKVVDVLTAASGYLAGKGIESPGLAAKMLLGRLLNCKPLELAFRYDVVLSDRHLEAMRRGVKRVAAGEPVQYVIGETGFMGQTVKVDARALIPRPETEGLVEIVLQCEALWRRPAPVIVDVGTGSGCIVVSLARERAQARYVACDISAEALTLARENAAAQGLAERISFAQSTLGEALPPESADAVISNLPYIPSATIDTLAPQVRDHEPRVALDGGPDGLRIIEDVIGEAAIALKPGGWLFLEIGAEQGDAVRELLGDAGFDAITVHRDLAGHDRVVAACLPEG